MNKRAKTNIAAITAVALITAVICILAPLSVPIGPVPVSLGVFGVYLGVYILGAKKGTIAVLLYLLIGLIGVPVFSGFSGGVGKLLGPTGGYLIGYIPMALIAGYFIDRFYKKPVVQFIGMAIGLGVLYVFGTFWLAYQAGLDLPAAFAAGVIPFIPFDIAKIVVSIILGRAVRKSLNKAGLLMQSRSARTD